MKCFHNQKCMLQQKQFYKERSSYAPLGIRFIIKTGENCTEKCNISNLLACKENIFWIVVMIKSCTEFENVIDKNDDSERYLSN